MTTEINTTELTTTEPVSNGAIFAPAQFEHAQRIAKVLSSSDLVPTQYKNNVANTLVALEMANRMGASPLMVMQNLHIIHGRPSWGSSFIIASLNSCGRFTTIRFQGDANKCKAVATDKVTGELLEGPTVSLEMAKAEGWLTKSGSKWVTMPELMLKYRAAAFFGRLYAPEVLMGMQTSEEVIDITPIQPASVDAINEKIKAK